MERKTTLTGDLAALAAEERSRLGEPPDAELLIAYRDGELSEEEAERVRDRLAVDPEWAEVYLELKRGGLDAPGVATAGLAASGAEDADVDAAWRELASKLEREPSSAEPLPFPRRRTGRVILAIAATLVVAVGLVWLLVGRVGPGLPEGKYLDVHVREETYRGLEISVPPDVVGLAFHIESGGLSGRLVVELLDASDEIVRREEVFVEPGTEEIVFRVALSRRAGRDSYSLAVRRSGASTTETPLMSQVFTFVFR